MQLSGRVAVTIDPFIEACARGEPSALERFCEENLDRVYRWSVFLGLSRPDAQDVTQEVLLTATRNIRRLKGEQSLRPWLFQITRRLVANRRKTVWIRRVMRRDADEETAFQETRAQEIENEIAVRACLRKIPQEQSCVLILMEIEGHSRRETAEILEVPEGTVASRLRLGREAFRVAWEKGIRGPIRWSWRESCEK